MTMTPTLRAGAVVALALLLTGCAAATLPPHVWLPVPHVERVDLFWWTDSRQCSIRVVFFEDDLPTGFTVPTDASLCLARLRDEGYDVSAPKAGAK